MDDNPAWQYLVDGSTLDDVERWFDCPAEDLLEGIDVEDSLYFFEKDEDFHALLERGREFEKGIKALYDTIGGILNVEYVCECLEDDFKVWVHRQMAEVARGKYEAFHEWLKLRPR